MKKKIQFLITVIIEDTANDKIKDVGLVTKEIKNELEDSCASRLQGQGYGPDGDSGAEFISIRKLNPKKKR